MLDEKKAKAMQRVLASKEHRFSRNVSFDSLVTDGIGTICGKSVYFNPNDREEMLRWLKAKGYSTAPADLTGLSCSKLLDQGSQVTCPRLRRCRPSRHRHRQPPAPSCRITEP